MSAGLYVIELGPNSIKVGRSGNVGSRLDTHLRHARGHGLDPYRYIAIPCPEHLLVTAEREAHAAVRAMGATATRSPEVFSGVHYSPVVTIVEGVVTELVAHEQALDWLCGRPSDQLDELLSRCSMAVSRVVRRAVTERRAR